MVSPKVSVLLTSYNYDSYIRESILSVINQTYKNWELIIIDDGSSDKSLDIISEFTAKYPDKIFLYTHENHFNKHLKSTLELGFSKISGKYLAFLESDDIWMPENIQLKVNCFEENSEVTLVYSDLDLLLQAGINNRKYINYIKYSQFIGYLSNYVPFNPLKYLFERNPLVSFSNIMIRSDIIDKINLNKEFEVWSDWFVIIHAAVYGKFCYINKKLFTWRVHETSTNAIFIKQHDMSIWNLLFKIEILNLVKQKYLETKNKELFNELFINNFSIKRHFIKSIHLIKFLFYSPVSFYYYICSYFLCS